MRRILGCVAVLLCAVSMAVQAGGIEKVRISGTKKTDGQRRGPTQSNGAATGNVKESDLFYRFEIQRIALDVPENLVCEYMVVVQQANGSLYPGACKTEEFVLAGAQAAVIDSEPVVLRALEWQGSGIGRGGGKIAEEINGWIVRVKDAKGALIGVKSQPKDLAEKWDAIAAEGQKRDKMKQFLNGQMPGGANKDRTVVVPSRALRPAPRPGGGHIGGRR